MKNIVLYGFMGCGKTTVGKRLAVLGGRPFADMDEMIERQAGLTVNEIFERHGEREFRRRENAVCAMLGEKQGFVIAAGGGALLDRRNRRALAENSVLVWLNIDEETAWRRLQGDSSRPLLTQPDKRKAMHNIFITRYPQYKSISDYIVNGEQSPDAVAREIIKELLW